MVHRKLISGLQNKTKWKCLLNAGLNFLRVLNLFLQDFSEPLVCQGALWISKRGIQYVAFPKLRTTEPFCGRCSGQFLFLLSQHPFPLSATDSSCFHGGLKGLNLNLCHFPHHKNKQVIQGWSKRVLLGNSLLALFVKKSFFCRSYWPDRIDQTAGWGKPVVCGIWENKRTPQCKLQKKCCPQKRRMVTTIAWDALCKGQQTSR